MTLGQFKETTKFDRLIILNSSDNRHDKQQIWNRNQSDWEPSYGDTSVIQFT